MRGHGELSGGLGPFRLRIFVFIERVGAALRKPAKHESPSTDGCLGHETSREMVRGSARISLAVRLATSIIQVRMAGLQGASSFIGNMKIMTRLSLDFQYYRFWLSWRKAIQSPIVPSPYYSWG